MKSLYIEHTAMGTGLDIRHKTYLMLHDRTHTIYYVEYNLNLNSLWNIGAQRQYELVAQTSYSGLEGLNTVVFKKTKTSKLHVMEQVGHSPRF